MLHCSRFLRSGVCALVLVSFLAACGSGGSSSGVDDSSGSGSGSGPDDSNQPAAIQGIATPSSVAVVTATNAD